MHAIIELMLLLLLRLLLWLDRHSTDQALKGNRISFCLSVYERMYFKSVNNYSINDKRYFQLLLPAHIIILYG